MGNKNIIVRSHIKQPSPGRYTTKSVLHTPSHFNGIQQSVERSKEICLPIMSRSEEVNIQLMRGTTKIQRIYYRNFLKTDNAKQVQKISLESLMPTSNIMPESNFGATPISNLVLLESSPLAPPNILLEPHPIQPMNLIRTTSTPSTTIFRIQHNPPYDISLMSVVPQTTSLDKTLKAAFLEL
jgi:hypothetical protein